MKIQLLFLILYSCLFAETAHFKTSLIEAPIVVPKKVVLLGTGLPGVGKSTLLKMLNQHISNSMFLDKDIINQCLLQGNSYTSDYYKQYVKNQTYEILLALAKDNLSQGNRIILLDGMFGDKLSSPLISPLFHSGEFEIKIIFFYCSAEKNCQRLIKRGDPRDEEKLKDFQEYYKKTIAVHQKELSQVSHLPINTEDPEAGNISLILQYIQN